VPSVILEHVCRQIQVWDFPGFRRAMDGWVCPGSRRGVRKRTAVPPTGVANLTIRLCPRNKTPGASRPPIQKTSLTTDPGTDLEIGLCLNHKPRTLVSPTHNSPGAPYPRISCLGWWGPRNFMRFSLEKTAHANAGWGCVQEIRVSRSFFTRYGAPTRSFVGGTALLAGSHTAGTRNLPVETRRRSVMLAQGYFAHVHIGGSKFQGDSRHRHDTG
jgi:hypothetical protein